MGSIRLLDCTLRDGSYIVEGNFGTPVLRGILRKLTAARVDVIECGWLKDFAHQEGSAYFHVPADALPLLPAGRRADQLYTLMIDYNRYDLDQLPPYEPGGIGAIRLVFPKAHRDLALPLGRKIRKQGYRLFLQPSNTLSYNDEELLDLAKIVNEVRPEVLSIVDTFGAMFPEDMQRIFPLLDGALEPGIGIGFHSHNNQQLSFALSMEFLKLAKASSRDVVVDASLSGMGRGAGNTPTELLTNYLVRRCGKPYDMNEIMDAIDLYLTRLREEHQWGYTIPYAIAGMSGTHVNNVAYLLNHHGFASRDMRLVFEALPPEKRGAYDYDLLEELFQSHQKRAVDDEDALAQLKQRFRGREVLLLGPGRTLTSCQKEIARYVEEHHPALIGVNAVPEDFACEALFFVNPSRYLYACETQSEALARQLLIITSNLHQKPEREELILNFDRLTKPGWEFFDNGCITALRLAAKCEAAAVAFAGFDGFPEEEEEGGRFYADRVVQPEVPLEKRRRINAEVTDMLRTFLEQEPEGPAIRFITPSRFAAVAETTDSHSSPGVFRK